ncbi:hypothetical protein Ahy_B03g067091 isoform J [Arachis hypogaea]|uniref:C3H1-type domain-containing protein n=1 Tax=Arachis hypogaea TaxID=3818 RepID=A0A445A5S2_ARAHY|nr:hypothetical protein Ahy_B03g067091 isoform J [Arachis hypogaea]
MVERKQFKTRLCVPYQRGRCTRHNCNFAHGNAELRRFSATYNVRFVSQYLSNNTRKVMHEQKGDAARGFLCSMQLAVR